MSTEEEKQDYIVIKCRFKAIDTNTFGLILIFLNKSLRVCESVNLVASHFSSIYETNPKENWSGIEDRINGLKWRGEYATAISNDTQDFLDDFLKGPVAGADEFFDFVKNNVAGKLQNSIVEKLIKPLGDRNIDLELAWDLISSEDILDAKKSKEDQSFSDMDEGVTEDVTEQLARSAGFDIESGSVLLNIDLILAPVSGIPIFNLKKGDRILVKINPNTNRGQYFIDLLGVASKNGHIKPVPATVHEVKMNELNEYALLVKIGDGIFGHNTEAEQVKLKRFNPENGNKEEVQISNPFVTPKKEIKEDKAITNLYWLMYFGGFVVLAAIVFIVITLI